MNSFKSPAYRVIAVPVEKIQPNDYNPNSVAPPEMALLYDSIRQDGYTMPIVCYYDEAADRYIIVDGFHRYRIMLDYPDIYGTMGEVRKYLEKTLNIQRCTEERLYLMIHINRLCAKEDCHRG